MLPLISSVLPALKRKSKAGLPPGTVVFVGEEKTHPITLSVMDFGEEAVNEYTTDDVADVAALRDTPTVSWINVNGLHDTALIRAIGDHFGLHPLVQEDIAHTGQRPKLEAYDDALFLTTPMIYHAADEEEDGVPVLRSEHVSLFVGSHYVISFQEEPGDVFDPVRERIRSASSRIRTRGSDYLAYALIDVIVDHYFVVLEQFGETAETIEDEVLEEASTATQRKLNVLRRDLIQMRRAAWPVRELLGQLNRLESPLIHDTTRPFLRDAYDHAVQAVDVVESLRDLVSGLTDLYMTALSNRMNEIMKVLTIIGTIFIPLTFIAGIYGMNFEHMPELGWRYGYLAVWIVMIALAGALLLFFRRRHWI